ncbi:MAG: M20 family metallopeptidase [Clostridia bacterium]|jgi:succinyl-diaminopimelate desuccinylase|nr:M20 family metallopeptidase [Clostridia bacterium]
MSNECDYKEVIELTRELVRIPSENPTGSEAAVGEYIYRWLDNQGLDVRREPVEGDRFNVVARLPGREPEVPRLIWLAHMDTVPAGDGWSRDPFGGEIVEGRLYGRGSADMKGGLAAAMVAMKKLARQESKPRGDLILLATVDEEGPEMKGAMAALKNGWVSPDSYLVAVEPSGLKVLGAHKGPLWYQINTAGKLAHAGNPQQGVDAIHAMSACLMRIKELVGELPYDDELLGPATVNIGRITGGVKTNMVPDHCQAEIDIRSTIPMTVEEADELVERALREGIAQVPGAKASWRRLGLQRPPQKMPLDSPLLQAFMESVQKVVGEVSLAGFPAYTDGAILASLVGTPHCLTFGPGYLEQAHAVDEYVSIDQLIPAVKVLEEAALRLLW